jgi:hypothetical protein
MRNKKLCVYLDNCCYNRPFDDQEQLSVQLETQAEMFVFTIKAEEPFNYTEWRRDNLFEDMSPDELLYAAAEYAKTYRPAL